VDPVGGGAGQQRDRGDRRGPGEPDDAGLRGRAGQGEREQRVDERRRLGPGRRQELPRLEQHEVPVAVERGLGGGCGRAQPPTSSSASASSAVSPSAIGPRSMYSSRRWALPPVVTPTVIAGTPRP